MSGAWTQDLRGSGLWPTTLWQPVAAAVYRAVFLLSNGDEIANGEKALSHEALSAIMATRLHVVSVALHLASAITALFVASGLFRDGRAAAAVALVFAAHPVVSSTVRARQRVSRWRGQICAGEVVAGASPSGLLW